MFVHHVFFWLKDGSGDTEKAQLEKGIQALLTINDLFVFSDVGKPAATDRPVIDRTYHFSLLLVFRDQKGQDEYQVHPTHLRFVETCAHLWSHVKIYDSETV